MAVEPLLVNENQVVGMNNCTRQPCCCCAVLMQQCRTMHCDVLPGPLGTQRQQMDSFTA
jgi:hypothetical protein